MRNHLLLLTATTTWALAACDAEPGSFAAEPVVVVETIGDTTVVRTLSGSVWEGEATLVPEISIGELDGPEELIFGNIRSIAVDDDRSVYVFDDQAQEVFVPGTTETQRWRYDVGGLYSRSPLYTDMSGRTFLHTRDLSRDDFVMHIIVFGPDGTQIDTLPEPSTTHEPPEVTAERGRSSVSYFVPFSPELHWAVHPSGRFLTGFSSDYRIDLARDDGVVRIERAADPVPVHDDERAYEREIVVQEMQNFDPDWSWNGPPIPEHKPFFRDLVPGRDGRIWVRVSTEARAVENEHYDPEDPTSAPVLWREPVRFDVFDPDGTYLGAVSPPENFSAYPDPVFDGDYVWAVTQDELGVERVVRFRIVVV